MPFTLSHMLFWRHHCLNFQVIVYRSCTRNWHNDADLYRVLVQTEIHLNHQFKGIIYQICVLDCYFAYCGMYCIAHIVQVFRALSHNVHSALSFFKFLFWMILAILLGTATHIWDGLTHLDFRTFAFNDFLAQPVSIFDHILMHKSTNRLFNCCFAFLFWMGFHYF
jgi:hypothetical protein